MDRTEEKRTRRDQREMELGAKIRALPNRLYGVIYADPAWRFEPYSRITGMDRAADNHYPTMTLDRLKNLAVGAIAAKDCVLFLWATAPLLPEALDVMKAWGFQYKSHCVWVKNQTGTGYWFRSKHELLLVGTRGSVPAPAPGTQMLSALRYDRGAHSAKPHQFRDQIAKLFPTLPKIELFARGVPAPSWD